MASEVFSRYYKKYSVITGIGAAVWLLASPGFYMSLGVLWFDIANIFNPAYNRQALGFVISTENPDPIYKVMSVVSAFGMVLLLLGVVGMLITGSRKKR